MLSLQSLVYVFLVYNYCATRGTQARNFLHNVDFGHNMTIEVLCTTFEQNLNFFD
jgi:hypothetical protein